MILTHCSVCHHALASVDIEADCIEEVTVSWTCVEGHSDFVTARVPSKQRAVTGHGAAPELDASFVRPKFGPMARAWVKR